MHHVASPLLDTVRVLIENVMVNTTGRLHEIVAAVQSLPWITFQPTDIYFSQVVP